MRFVYVLHHVHNNDDACEDLKVIGIYRTREAASEAIARLSTRPGFLQSREGFHIDRYELDVDHWAEGFVQADGDTES